MNNLRLITRFYSTPINMYNFNKVKKIVKSKEHKQKFSSYENMYNGLKKVKNKHSFKLS